MPRRRSSWRSADGMKRSNHIMRLMQKSAVLLALAALPFAVSLSAQHAPTQLLVLNKDDATLAIVELLSGEVMGKVPTGQAPHELVTSTDGKFAFASNYGTGPAPGHTIS